MTTRHVTLIRDHPERERTIRDINEQINEGFEWRSDYDVYGMREWWTTLVNAAGYGDCEDRALTMLMLLLRLDWINPWSLRLAGLHIKDGGKHMVLIIQTDKGDYFLDNIIKYMCPVNHAPSDYKWELIHVPGTETWVEIKGVE